GASVLLLDKQRFPRDKPCGGGVTLRAAAVQDIDLSPVIERTIYGARFSLRLGESFDRTYAKPLTYMTQRCRLDAHLAEKAAGAGAAGLNPHSEEAVALEGNLPFSPDIPEDWRKYVGIDLGGLAGGYGWVFPKSEHLNAGVGAWKYATFTLRPKLTQLCIRYGFDASRLENLRGHHLPLRTAHSPIAVGPIALVGDAAGLIDPL